MLKALTTKRLAVFGAVGLAGTLIVLGCAFSQQGEEKLEPVPLAEVYASREQKGLKQLDLSVRSPFNEDVIKPFVTLHPRASNIFLTSAENIEEATQKALTFDGGNNGGARLILPKKDSTTWLVVFLGFNCSSPLQWKLESVKCGKSKIRATYWTETLQRQRTRDSEPYLYVAPLKDVKPSVYELELFDSVKEKMTIKRRVEVEVAK
jgi:hypothetical protein